MVKKKYFKRCFSSLFFGVFTCGILINSWKHARGEPERFAALRRLPPRDQSAVVSEEPPSPRRYVVISLAAVVGGDGYSFLLPFTVAAWKKIGWSSITIVTGTYFESEWFSSNIKPTILEVDPHASFIWIECSAAQKVSISQIARLFAATAKWIRFEDAIMTSDVDLLPVSGQVYDSFATSEEMTILNADCCGKIRVGTREVVMQPMSNIYGIKRDWLSLMDIHEADLSVHLINNWMMSHDFDTLPTSPAVKGENQVWYLDQAILSVRLSTAENKMKKIERDTSKDRIDRIFPETWPTMLTEGELQSKTDMHAWLPAFHGQAWIELSNFTSRLLNRGDHEILSNFRMRLVNMT